MKKYVPDEGPKDSDIMIVGEAPGEDEELEGRPFIGRSGQLLERYLNRVGIKRDEVYLTNLCHYKPPWNKFARIRKSNQLSEGLAELSQTIRDVNPNIIVALGNWPMYYLTNNTSSKGGPGSGISSWRGSVIPASDENVPMIAGRKVLVTYHPAFIVRPGGFSQHPIFLNDLGRIKKESETTDFLYPEYEVLINPPDLHKYVEEMSQAEWLSVDIETFGEQLACVGFADSENRGMCLTFESPESNPAIESLLRSPAKKIFQFGTFDINWLRHYQGWMTENYAFDTFIAAANLMPEFKRGLDFLTSIYTNIPFYKEERKVWKATGDMRTLWEYNVKDIIATYIIAMKQMEELEEIYEHH